MLLHRLQNAVTLDRAMAGLVASGFAVYIHDASEQGRAPLRGAVPAHSFGEGMKRYEKVGDNNQRLAYPKLSLGQCRLLEKQGYLVIDEFLSKKQVQEAQDTIRRLDAQQRFGINSNGYDETSGKPVRTDRVFMNQLAPTPVVETENPWSRITRDPVVVGQSSEDAGVGLHNVQIELGHFARALADSDFVGFDEEPKCLRYSGDKLQVPTGMQVTIFEKAQNSDDTDDYFTSHLDSAAAEGLQSLGLVGWIRSKYVRKRYLTCIVYLNSEWQEGDGGSLRLHDSTATMGTFDSEGYKDFAPLAGRLVVFSSWSQWHAVLPTLATRYACSLWLTLEDDGIDCWFR